jgi:hypothetical protein
MWCSSCDGDLLCAAASTDAPVVKGEMPCLRAVPSASLITLRTALDIGASKPSVDMVQKDAFSRDIMHRIV